MTIVLHPKGGSGVKVATTVSWSPEVAAGDLLWEREAAMGLHKSALAIFLET